jgi:hypothetical protein
VDDNKRHKYEKSLKVFSEAPPYPSHHFKVAFCLTKLERYLEALGSYRLTLQGFLKDRRGWHGTSQPNWLADCYVMANCTDFYSQVRSELDTYERQRPRISLWARYAYALIRLASGEDGTTKDYVVGLLQKPKFKDMYATGKTIQSLVAHNQSAFDAALAELLKAHDGMTKHGDLRSTPEGYLCLPAMSLCKMAMERGMAINVESEYLSKGYLDYLMQVEAKPDKSGP